MFNKPLTPQQQLAKDQAKAKNAAAKTSHAASLDAPLANTTNTNNAVGGNPAMAGGVAGTDINKENGDVPSSAPADVKTAGYAAGSASSGTELNTNPNDKPADVPPADAPADVKEAGYGGNASSGTELNTNPGVDNKDHENGPTPGTTSELNSSAGSAATGESASTLTSPTGAAAGQGVDASTGGTPADNTESHPADKVDGAGAATISAEDKVDTDASQATFRHWVEQQFTAKDQAYTELAAKVGGLESTLETLLERLQFSGTVLADKKDEGTQHGSIENLGQIPMGESLK